MSTIVGMTATDGTMQVTEGNYYVTVAASTTKATLGGVLSGAKGDWLDGILVVPATTSPGVVNLFDGTGSAINVFAGGSTSTSNLVPFFIPICSRSQSGGWQITTGANLSVIATGNFT